jgi:hypothetical protein
MLAIGGLLALLALVAVATAGRTPGAGTGGGSVRAPGFVADYLASIALVLVPLGAIVFVLAMFQRKAGKASGVAKRGSWVKLVFPLVLVALAFAIGPQFRHGFKSQPDRGRTVPSITVPTTKGGGGSGKARPVPQTRRAQFQWVPFLLLGSVVLGFVVAGTVVAIRRRRGTLSPEELAAAFSAVLKETLDDLRQEPDPRKAVIRTYARMEKTLAAKGLPRRPFEAPLEYLARVLDAVQAGADSARRLTGLFERARFSAHSINATMKSDAIDALVALRLELEAPR